MAFAPETKSRERWERWENMYLRLIVEDHLLRGLLRDNDRQNLF